MAVTKRRNPRKGKLTAPVKQGRWRVLVVDPKGEALVVERIEDGPLRKPFDELVGVVARRAVRCRRVDEQPVRLRRRWHRREPEIADPELHHQLFVYRNGVRIEAAHHRGGHSGLLFLRFLGESIHERRGRGRDWGLTGDEGDAIDLLVDCLDGVAGIGVDVLGATGEADDTRRAIGG